MIVKQVRLKTQGLIQAVGRSIVAILCFGAAPFQPNRLGTVVLILIGMSYAATWPWLKNLLPLPRRVRAAINFFLR